MWVLKVVTDVVVVIHQCFQFEQQRQVLQTKVFKKVIEITPNKILQAEMVRIVTFNEVTQQTTEAARLNRLQLLLHRVEIGGEGELVSSSKRMRYVGSIRRSSR